MKLQLLDLGFKGYKETLIIQKDLMEKRRKEEIEDTLILVEHNPVLTIGKSGKSENIIVSDETLKEENIEVLEIDRGGDITYHGPGQLVGYPIINIQEHKMGVKEYITNLEEVFIKMIKSEYNIDACRDEINNGVWVNKKKITALGVTIKRWVTMHGFAFNVNTKLSHFSYIVPCGIVGREVTSLEKELNEKVDFEKAKENVLKYFCEIFNYNEVDTNGNN